MTDVIQRGTAQRAAVALQRKDIAGKTGTTSDRRDTWFVGFNADVAAAVWLGFDQERSLGENEEGGKTALPMWIYFMQEALRDKPEHRQPEPPGVVRTWVSRESGAPTRAGAPGALFETFLEQYAPQPGAIPWLVLDSSSVTSSTSSTNTNERVRAISAESADISVSVNSEKSATDPLMSHSTNSSGLWARGRARASGRRRWRAAGGRSVRRRPGRARGTGRRRSAR